MNVRRVFFLLLCFVSAAANAAAWRRYSERGCIGGSECRQNGRRITIGLESAPVIGVRFFAHDNIGQRADGKLSVRIDGNAIASYIDVQRNGKVHEFDVDRLRGDRLVIEAANDDEVELRDIEVLYADRGYDRDDRGGRDSGADGGCIGGSTCGGRRARIAIPLRDRRVRSVSFHAHDNVGNRTMGELRIRIDDSVIEDNLDIERNGREYNIDGHDRRGRLLIIEPSSDDEVVIKDIRVRYDR
ncbi:MAG: hypothetical protein AABO58_14685 [Acidobacteriota bacterium]